MMKRNPLSRAALAGKARKLGRRIAVDSIHRSAARAWLWFFESLCPFDLAVPCDLENPCQASAREVRSEHLTLD